MVPLQTKKPFGTFIFKNVFDIECATYCSLQRSPNVTTARAALDSDGRLVTAGTYLSCVAIKPVQRLMNANKSNTQAAETTSAPRKEVIKQSRCDIKPNKRAMRYALGFVGR